MQEAKDAGTVRWRHIDAGQSVDPIVQLVLDEIETVCNQVFYPHEHMWGARSCPLSNG